MITAEEAKILTKNSLSNSIRNSLNTLITSRAKDGFNFCLYVCPDNIHVQVFNYLKSLGYDVYYNSFTETLKISWEND